MTAIRVLHVEDEPDIREVVEISLNIDPRFVTRGCGSGSEALQAAEAWTPDIILLDAMMPAMDGPATLTRLRCNTMTAGIPVVFLTACVQARELDRFRSLGVVGIIPKPFDPMTLAHSVRAFMQQGNERLDALRVVFLHRVNDDAAALMRLRCALNNREAATAAMSAIRDIAHGLAGAGGIFGHPEISDAAIAVEQAIVAKPHGSDSAPVLSALSRLLVCMEARNTHHKATPHFLLGA